MTARLAPLFLAAALAASAPDSAQAQAHKGLRCIANPDADCAITLTEQALIKVPESRWHLILPNLAQALVYNNRGADGLDLAEKIRSQAVRRLVYLARAEVLFQEGDLGRAREFLEEHGGSPVRSANDVAGWARAAFKRGDKARGAAAIGLARALLKDHEAAAGKPVSAVALPGALAASGAIDAAIDLVRDMPEPHDRVDAAILLVEDLPAGPDRERARPLLEEASALRAGFDPVRASRSLVGEAWAWVLLGNTDRTLALAESVTDPKRRDSTLAFLVFRAGSSGNADAALLLAEKIKAPHEKAWALAECARQSFAAGHLEAAMACLEASRVFVSGLLENVNGDALDAEQRAHIDRALGSAAIAESLAGNDARVARIIKASGIYGRSMGDQIITAHIDAGDYTLAMLLAYQGSDALKQAKALSYLARVLAKKEFDGE